MVKVLSRADKGAVAQAIAEAEKQTCAELVVVVSPASDAYQSYFLLYGLIIGSAISAGLWAVKLLTAFPLLLVIQIAFMSLFAFVPWLRHLLLWLVPRHTCHHRAAHRAYEEYLIVSRHVSATTPILLLYISLAEHYAHIVPSRSVREKITDETWNAIIKKFTNSLGQISLGIACTQTIRQIAELLAVHFPEIGELHKIKQHVIEAGSQ